MYRNAYNHIGVDEILHLVEKERNLEHLYALSSAGKSSQIRFNSFLNINNSLNKYTTTKQT